MYNILMQNRLNEIKSISINTLSAQRAKQRGNHILKSNGWWTQGFRIKTITKGK